MDATMTGYESSACSTSSYDNKLTRRLTDIQKACVILADDGGEDKEVVDILQKLGLSVHFRQTGQLEMVRSDVSCIVVQDFAAFLDRRDPSLLYYGPTCVKRVGAELTDKPEQKAELPFTGHSMLTTLLYGFKCCLQVPKSIQLKSRAQVYALGGRLARKVHEANLLIMTSASGEQYKLAQNFRIPVVATGFLDALWEQRDSLDFEVTPEFIENFRLPVFSRLKINFFGFHTDKLQELKERTEANNGIYVENISRDHTFIVVVSREGCTFDDLQRLDQELSLESSIVYEDWFHESIKDGYALCANQEKFDARRVAALQNSALSPLGRRKRAAESPGTTPRSKKSMEAFMSPRVSELSRLDSGMFSPAAGAASPIPKYLITDGRHMVLNELLETETNYLRVLRLIMKHATQDLGFDEKKKKKRDKSPEKNGGMSHFELQSIFKELPKIISLHEKILKRLEVVMNTGDYRFITQIFMGDDVCGDFPVDDDKPTKKRLSRKSAAKKPNSNNIVATYSTFFNGLDEIKERVKKLTNENPKFAEFVRRLEEHPDFERLTLLDHLTKPWQRWPSVVTILKRYVGECDKLADKLRDRQVPGNETQLEKEILLVKKGGDEATRVYEFIERSLFEMNTLRSFDLKVAKILNLRNNIEDMPSMPWSTDLSLDWECDALLVQASYNQKLIKNIECRCFVCTNGIEIARKKAVKSAKQYKHIAFISFEKINTLLIQNAADSVSRQYIEIVFRESKREPCVSAAAAAKYVRVESSASIADGDGDNISLSSVNETEYTEERICLDFLSPADRDKMLEQMKTTCKTSLEVETITAPVFDRKEPIRSDSILVNLLNNQNSTPVTQLARSRTTLNEMATPKKLTRSFSNLIKQKVFGVQKRDDPSSPHSPPNNATGTLSRSRNPLHPVPENSVASFPATRFRSNTMPSKYPSTL